MVRGKLKIILCTRDLCQGGAGTYTQTLIDAFEQSKYVSKILVIAPEKIDRTYSKTQFRVLSLKGKTFITQHLLFAIKCESVIRAALKEDNYSIIYTCSSFFIQRKLPIPLISIFHSFHKNYEFPLTNTFIIQLSKVFHNAYSVFDYSTLLNSDKIIFVSKKTLDYVRCNYPFLRQKLLHFPACIKVQNYYPLSPNNKEKLREKYNLDPAKKYVLFVGRLEPLKGVSLLVQAIASLAVELPVRLILVGDGMLADSVSTSPFVDYFERIDHDKMNEIYNLADLFVLPSYYENCPLVVLESMAAGCLTLTTNVGDTDKMVASPYSIIESGDLSKMINRIRYLINLENTSQKTIINKNSELVRKTYDSHIITKKLILLGKTLFESSHNTNTCEKLRHVTPSKILIITHAFPPSTGGGPIYYSLLTQSNPKILFFILTSTYCRPYKSQYKNRVIFGILPALEHARRSRTLLKLSVLYSILISFIFIILIMIKKKIQVIQTSLSWHIFPCAIISRIFNKKLILDVRSTLDFENLESLLKFVFHIKTPDLIIYNSHSALDFVKRHGSINCSARFAQNSTYFEKTTLPCPHHLPNKSPDRVRLLFVGRLEKRKGILQLISAFKKLILEGNNLELFIIGSGSLHTSIKSKSRWIKNIYLFGEVAHEHLPLFYKSADIFVLPSFTEGSPRSIIEAHHFNLPVISTTVGSIPELINHNNGLLVPPCSTTALYLALKELLRQKKYLILKKRMIQKSDNTHLTNHHLKNIYNSLK